MKKAIVAVLAVLVIVFITVCITLAISSNKESEDTISRIDSKIERCER